MSGTKTYLDIAAEMVAPNGYGPDGLNGDFRRELDMINQMCESVGSQLRSRQVIATIIYNWERNNRHQEPYDPS